MKKKDVIKHYGTAAKVAQALKISRQAVHQWPAVVPFRAALKLHDQTMGDLSLRVKDYL